MANGKLIFAFMLLTLFLLILLLHRSALISEEFLCDGKIENNSRKVANHAGDKIPFCRCKLFSEYLRVNLEQVIKKFFLTVAMILDDVFHVTVLLVAKTQTFSVVVL